MKQFLSYMIVALAALWMAGCSDDSLSPADQPERGIVIRLSTGDLETRTDLTSQANLQHVTEVYAVLYAGTGDTATFVSVEKLDWNPSEDGNGFQKEEFTLPKTATESLLAGDYTILCVGLDDNSGDTYGLSDGTMNWKTLAEAKATLAAGKTANDIAHSELFAGWAEFDFEPDNINIVEVEMKRRVAGVLCYLKDIPYKLNKGNNTYRITEIRLNLMNKQNNQISLLRKEATKDNLLPDDFGEYNESAPATGQLIFSFDLMNYKPDTGNELYVIDNKGKSQLDNTLLKGAFILPIQGEAGKNTLELELLGYEYDDTNTTTHIKDQSSLTKVVTFPVEWESASNDAGDDSKSYSIRPNYIYHIGDKPDSDDTTGDYPMSLAGTKITVKPEPWTEMDVDVDFPSVPLMATMELECNGKNYLGGDDVNLECYGSYMYGDGSDFTLKISPSILKTTWKLIIEDDDDALFIDVDNNGVYEHGIPYTADEVAKEKGKEFSLFLNDYVKIEGKDSRKISIVLTTYDQEGNTVASQSITINQKKAFIIYMGDGYGYRAFANSSCGIGQWKYKGDPISTIFYASQHNDYDGYHNYDMMKENHKYLPNLTEDFPTSAVYVTYKQRVKVEITNGVANKKTMDESYSWYLPAIEELKSFMGSYGGFVDSGEYWSSNPRELLYKYAYSVYNDKGDWSVKDNTLRDVSLLLHRACKAEL